MEPGLILVVDDEQRQRETLSGVLKGWGHEVRQAASAEAAREMVRGEPVDLLLTDLRMPGMSGVDLLHACRELRPDIAVVVMTAYGTIEGAVQAMRDGAFDFLTKPIDLDQLELVVRRALGVGRLVRENRALRRRLTQEIQGRPLLGGSDVMQEVLSRAARAAETDATVLVRGESGTGKELLARTLHDLSARSGGPFVAVNCAALPETLLESELFGHVRGAFTGADRDRSGRVRQAAGGTLFLDEIGEISPAVQVKLLRFLQNHEVTPVGGEKTERVDVRVLAATNRDLEESIRTGAFREDLFYRLNVVAVVMPPLRERRGDIPELATLFLERFAERYGRRARTYSAEAMAALVSYDYPGNVRELENIVEQTVVMTPGEVIHREDLPRGLQESTVSGPTGAPGPEQVHGDLPRYLEALERRIVEETLSLCGGNKSDAARRLGLTESGLRYKLGKWQDDGNS